MDRPTVLVCVKHFTPGYKHGGPVRAVANLVERLGGEYNFHVVTSDRDAGDDEPYRDVPRDAWVEVGRCKVLYLSRRKQSWANWRALLASTPHDLIHLNSLFDRGFTLKPLLARLNSREAHVPVIIAPRGELAPSALSFKRARKAVVLGGLRASGVQRRVIWQASSRHEAGDICAALSKSGLGVAVAPDLSAPVSETELPAIRKRKDGAPFRVAFLSRIAPMKNLEFAIRVMREVRSPVRFEISGVVADEGYWARCRAMLDEMPPHVTTCYRGGVAPREVLGRLAESDLFLLPTLGENHGHAIHEALLSGLPVVISDRTRWRDLADKGLGADLPLSDAATFTRAIERFAQTDVEAFARIRRRIRRYAIALAEDPTGVAANRRLLEQALAGVGYATERQAGCGWT